MNHLCHLFLATKNSKNENIYNYTQINFSYNSNRIEGSKISLIDTKKLFLNKCNYKSFTLNDEIETINHFTCFDFILNSIDEPISEDYIKKLHKILKSNTSDAKLDYFNVGEYKKLPNMVGDKKTALPEEVPLLMNKLLNDYLNIKNVTFNDVIAFHVGFENIHPFQDGNGRVGRLIMFRECLKHNIVPFIILDEYKDFYYRGLKEWKYEKGYLIDTCLSMQDQYREMLKYFKIKI